MILGEADMATILELQPNPQVGTYFLLSLPCGTTGEPNTVVKLVSLKVTGRNTEGHLGYAYVFWNFWEKKLEEVRGCGIHQDQPIFIQILTPDEAKQWAPDRSFKSRPKRVLS
jgi:hypothetical protein